MNKSREILNYMDTQAYRPLTQEELIKHFSIKDVHEIKEFSKTLNEMEENGAIILTRKMRYGLPKRMNLIVVAFRGMPKVLHS